eukprot:scaffold94737_cov42-Cyclotella_meneghiniana.AAC.2
MMHGLKRESQLDQMDFDRVVEKGEGWMEDWQAFGNTLQLLFDHQNVLAGVPGDTSTLEEGNKIEHSLLDLTRHSEHLVKTVPEISHAALLLERDLVKLLVDGSTQGVSEGMNFRDALPIGPNPNIYLVVTPPGRTIGAVNVTRVIGEGANIHEIVLLSTFMALLDTMGQAD